MSQEKIDKDAEDRREAADYLYGEASRVIERMQTVADSLGSRLDSERNARRQKAEQLASEAQSQLGLGNTAPSEEILEKARQLVESAKVHANGIESIPGGVKTNKTN